MSCPTASSQDTAERYVAGDLAGEERDAFEAHVFECDRCFSEVRTLEALRSELAGQGAELETPAPPRGTTWFMPYGAVAAILVLGLGVALWRRPTPPAPQSASAPAPAAVPQPSPEVILALARIEPPPYVALTVRGDATATTDFDRGIAAYGKGDFQTAARALGSAAAGEPGVPAPLFFLGISRLMIEDARGAVDVLQKCVALGPTPYQQAARVALARAQIRTGDLDAAERELVTASQLAGDEAAEAMQLLERLRAARSIGR